MILAFQRSDNVHYFYVKVDEDKEVYVSSYKTKFQFIPIVKYPLIVKPEVLSQGKDFDKYEADFLETKKKMDKILGLLESKEEITSYVIREMKKHPLNMNFITEIKEENYEELIK